MVRNDGMKGPQMIERIYRQMGSDGDIDGVVADFKMTAT